MADSEPAYPRADDGALLEGMRTAADLGALVLVHAENDAMLKFNMEHLRSQGRTDPIAHHESRPPIVEEEAANRALFLAKQVGARLQVVHSSSPGTVRLVRDARASGQQATIEVCSHHLLLDLGDLERLGPFGRCAPALRERALVEQMWDYVLDGTIDCLVSDHCAYTLEEKRHGYEDIFLAPNGCQVMQEMVPVVLDEAYHRRGMRLDAFARLISERPARIAGLYPRKGSLLVGSDADLVLWDLEGSWIIDPTSQQFSKNPWSPFEGRKCQARVVRTFVARGDRLCGRGHHRVAGERPVRLESGGLRPLRQGRLIRCSRRRSIAEPRCVAGRAMTFRLLVINPNSDERVTSDLRARVLSVLPPGVSVEAVDCPRSPSVIETAVDDILAGPDVLRAALGAVGVDAYLVAVLR